MSSQNEYGCCYPTPAVSSAEVERYGPVTDLWGILPGPVQEDECWLFSPFLLARLLFRIFTMTDLKYRSSKSKPGL